MSTKAISGCTECGWTSKYTTPAHAERAYRLHSCERQRRQDELTARSRARDGAVDRNPRSCLHKRANHQHGTYACYVLDFCRCLPCAAANSRYEAERVRRLAYGRAPYVDAGPAREHVLALMEAGMGWKRVARTASVPSGVMTKLLYGERTRGQAPSRRIRPATAQRILAVQLDLAPGTVVDGTGAARRLQALTVAGWSQSHLAARLGILPSNFTATVHGRSQITVERARAVQALYDQMSGLIPPTDTAYQRAAVYRVRLRAAAAGWAPAIAWDEDTIDDPQARPNLTGFDEARVSEWLAEQTRPADADQLDAIEVLTRLIEDGFTTMRQQTLLTGLDEAEVTALRKAHYYRSGRRPAEEIA